MAEPMPIDHRTELAGIKRFDQLVRYLRDRLGWPIDGGDFEELTFEYTPEELGIEAKSAAKIQEIKRLRPLSPRQPWGIFFVKFEPKKLPVVALRRILNQVALKKRASANSAERAAWAADDLLFVSNYGEGDERRISFAHFSKAQGSHDLPTLKVLGWDNLDTALHLDAVARELIEHLAWPDDDTDVEAWRERWRTAFTLRHREVVTTSKQLSIRLAGLARAIRDRIRAALAIETERGPLTTLMKAFREALVHDLDADGFADMYAQTIAYGLLSARIADPQKKTADDFAGHMRTNPFLRELMETFLKVGGRRGKAGGPGIDFDELGVSEVVELLDDANMEAVVRDFGDRNPQEDPVIHFYEHFLAAYDKKQKVQRGVFYTPRPVVSYIVRSVDELLRTEFGLEDGLADTTTWGEMSERHTDLKIPEGIDPGQAFVQILDPATGTGTFLVEAIDLIHGRMAGKWKAQGQGEQKLVALWNEYVPKHLLPRLHGYELLMAPYAIAHLKIGLKLYETGYRFGNDERARVYLTNSLEPASDMGQMKLTGILPALAHEAQEVNEIKRAQRFTVIIGNPPYAGESMNKGAWIRALIETYMYVDGAHLSEKGKKNWLQDDYVKFFRFSQFLLDQAGPSILGFITNHSYLDNPTFRGMRASLVKAFSGLSLLDLHGNTKRRESSPDGTPDENVFDIQQGVAIALLLREPRPRQTPVIRSSHLWGFRNGLPSAKYERLMEGDVLGTNWTSIEPSSPNYLFVKQDVGIRREFDCFWKLTEVMPHYGAGVITSRDDFVVAFADASLLERLELFADRAVSDTWLRDNFGISDNSMWSITAARRAFRTFPIRKDLVVDYLYRPFDRRRIYFETNVVFNMRIQIMRHLLGGKGPALLTARQATGKGVLPAFVSKSLVDAHAITDATSITTVFPLFLHDEAGGMQMEGGSGWAVNIRPAFSSELRACLEGIGNLTGRQGLQNDAVVTPLGAFQYIYSILNSPAYCDRYAESLKADFPRVPLPRRQELLRALARLGGELVGLHLMESSKLDGFITRYTGPRNPEVTRVGWSEDTVWLDAATAKKGQPAKGGTIGFRGVPEAVWNFHIGGYQVCEKWLKDRKGRKLSKDDITHYQKIVVALAETIRLMQEIDEVIDAHGGWPGAFQVARAAEEAAGHILKVAEPPAKFGSGEDKGGR